MSKNIKIQGTDFNVKSVSGDVEFNLFGNLTVDKNLIVNGTTVTVNSETLTIADNLVILNSNMLPADAGSPVVVPTENAGIGILRGDSNQVELLWNETDKDWEITLDATNPLGTGPHKLIHRGITGANSGLDADLLDGIDSTEFAIKANNELITGRYTFNETGNDTAVILDGTLSSVLDYNISGVVRAKTITTLINYTLNSYDATGTLLSANLQIDVTDGTLQLSSPTLIKIDTPIVHAVNDLELKIKAGDASVLDTSGSDIVLAGGTANGTGSHGAVVLGDQPLDDTLVRSPQALTIVSDVGNINILPAADIVIQNIQYPATDGAARNVFTTDGVGTVTIQPLDFNTLLTNPDSLSSANNIIKMNPAGTAWEYIVDFRNVVEDLTPELGGNLNTKNFEIVTDSGNDIKLNPDVTGNILLGGTEPTILVLSPTATALTLSSGNNIGAVNGEDLTLQGGTSVTGADGKVIIGRPNGTETSLSGPVLTDLRIEADLGNKLILGPTGATTGAVIGPDGGDLTLSGGEGFALNEDGGDLILTGGQSISGTDGTVIFASPVSYSSLPPTGVSYPLNFFVPDLITSGLNPNIIVDSVGITENTTIQGAGHIGYAVVAPTFNASYIIQRIRVGATTSIGSMTINAGTNSAAFVNITDANLLAGDIVHILNSPSPDATIANITITLRTVTL